MAGCAPREAEQPAAVEEGTEAPTSDASYAAEIDAWHADRVERLRAEGGWLSLAGLHWLPEGEASVGSEPVADVVLPSSAPLRVGTLTRQGAEVRLQVLPGVEATHDGEPVRDLEMISDAAEEPTEVELGTLSFYVIERGERVGVRVKDTAAPSRTGFAGIERFPVDRRWRVEARFEPYEPPRDVEVADYAGGTQEAVAAGTVAFEAGGETHRLEALDAGDELFLIFSDATTGDTTYGAGRYLYAEKPGPDGRVVVDFNKAYNPPCAFTPFATCPLPPRQNRLEVAIEAGEKTYHGPGTH
ncbi:MAG TPA: DUF1684 domain-containing protein [Thermoanaerobaculia bacterium]|nr:DUF1684 domain-containing protein [Thermoanaerobaculia bacterium]